ncbi:MAG: addA, partial [Bacteroidetes bacterium]|nr:addA [Bacteroidota bacterium]
MEYLRLLFTNDFAYRHILAVTFTNKATEEMKRRIVEELFKRSALDPKSERILIN